MKKTQRDPLLYGIIGALVGGVVIWYITISSINNNNVGMMSMMGVRNGAQNAQTNANVLDAHFIEQMIPHHKDAITMANLAQTKAKREEVKQLAQNIIDSQGKEIDQMKNWYKEWFGREVDSGADVHSMHGMTNSATQNNLHMGMMGDMSDTTRLENATDFDRAFVEDMIPHHQMAVMMATMLKNGTNRPEMRKLADDIIVAQTKEINEMRTWLKEW
jgi:uncharacterized protein (DUF305 family)